MNKDAKIGIATAFFIGLISLLAWSNRQRSDQNLITFVKHKKEVYRFSVGTPASSIEKWSKQQGLSFRVTSKNAPFFTRTNIVLFSGVPLKAINSYGTAFSEADKLHGYQFIFNQRGHLLKAWAEDYSPGVKSNYSP